MARLLYGGTSADFAVALGSSVVIPDVIPEANARPALIPEGAVIFSAFDSPGGDQVTDLLDASGAPVMSVQTSVELGDLGRVPPFFGPDLYTADLWLSTDGTTYYRVAPSTAELFGRVAAAESALVTVAEAAFSRELDTGGASVSGITTDQVIATLEFDQVAGKRYRVTAMPNGAASAIGTLVRLHVRENDISGPVLRGAISEFPAGSASSHTDMIVREYVAPATGEKTLVVVASAQGGNYTTFSSQSWYTVDRVAS